MSSSKQPKEDSPNAMPSSSRYRFFRWTVLFLAAGALLVQNDVTTIWPGAEGQAFWLASASVGERYLPVQLIAWLAQGDLWLFWPRLMSVAWMVAATLLFYFWGRPVLGKPFVETGVLIMGASLFLPVFGKIASGDAAVFCLHLTALLGFIRYQQGPRPIWLITMIIALLIGGLWAPLSTFLFALLLIVGSRWLWKPANQRTYVGVGAALLGSLLVWIADQGAAAAAFRYWSPLSGGIPHGRLLLYSLLGLLPLIGFTLAGFRDLVYNVRRGEALSRLLLLTVIASWIAVSPLFPFALILLTTKQLTNYYRSGYPWGNWVKAGAVLHLVFAAIAGIILLLGLFFELQGDGFRAALGMVVAYWMFSLIAVIGLYGGRRDYVLGGSLLAGSLAVLFFWVQVYPYVEVDRAWPKQLITKLEAADPQPVNLSEDVATLPAAAYLERSGYQPTLRTNAPPPSIQVLSVDSSGPIARATTQVDTIRGRSLFRLRQWLVIQTAD